MRKWLAAILVFTMFAATGCGMRSNLEVYERAQVYLGCEDYEHAAVLFAQLGEYRDSANYALYARALLAWQEGDLTLARNGLQALHPFKSSGRYLAYLDALDDAKAGRTSRALKAFEGLGTFGDSAKQAQLMRARLAEEQLEAEDARDEGAQDTPLQLDPEKAQTIADLLSSLLDRKELAQQLTAHAALTLSEQLDDAADEAEILSAPDEPESSEPIIDLSLPAEGTPDEAPDADIQDEALPETL